MDILFRGPTCTVPQSAIHYITRAIINKWLPGAVDIRLVKNVLINFDCLLVRKFLRRHPRPEHLTWMSLRVEVRCSERRLAGHVRSVIIWVRQRHGVGAISSRSGIQGVVDLGNMDGVEPIQRLE